MMQRTIAAAAALGAATLSAQTIPPSTRYPSYEPGPEVRNGYTAEDLRDAYVRGKNGERIGDIEDIIIGPDGQLRRLLVGVDEGFLGIGGRRLAVRWSDVTPGAREVGDIQCVTAPVTKRNVEEFGIFKDKPRAVKGGPREWRASELLGDYISLEDVENYGVVTDLLFDRSGKLQAIATAPDMRGSILPFYTRYSGTEKGWDPGDEYFILPHSESELKEILPKTAKQQQSSTGQQ